MRYLPEIQKKRKTERLIIQMITNIQRYDNCSTNFLQSDLFSKKCFCFLTTFLSNTRIWVSSVAKLITWLETELERFCPCSHQRWWDCSRDRWCLQFSERSYSYSNLLAILDLLAVLRLLNLMCRTWHSFPRCFAPRPIDLLYRWSDSLWGQWFHCGARRRNTWGSTHPKTEHLLSQLLLN